MRAVRICLAAALMACVLAGGGVRAQTDPASVVPRDVLVYVEGQQEAVQALLAAGASMPVMKLIAPQMQSRFALIESALHLPPGTFDEVAPHLRTVAFAVWKNQPMLFLSFDGAGWAEKLAQGGSKDASGAVSLPSGVSLLARETDLVIGSPDACEAVAGGDYEPLAKSADFQAARAEAGKRAVWAFVGVPAVLQAIAAEGTVQAEQMKPVLALIGLDSVPYAVSYGKSEGTNGEGTLSLKLAADQGGILGLLPQGAPPAPAMVPAGSSASLVLDWGDATAFLGGLKELLYKHNAENGDGTLATSIAGMEQGWGVTLDDLIAQMGAGAAVYLPAPGEDNMISRQDVTIVVLLKDPAKFQADLEAIMRTMMGAAPTTGTFDGTEMLQLMFPPCFMKYTADRVVIGLSPGAVSRYLKAQFPPQPAAAAEPSGALAIRLDLGLLTVSYPKPESGAKLFLVLRRDGSNLKLTLTSRDVTPASMVRLYAASYGAMAAMLMPALSRARGEAQKSVGMSNLHMIGLGISMYRNEHNDQYPPDLEVLVEDAWLEGPEVFLDPSDKDPQPRGAKGYRYSYEYAGPLPANVPPSFIVAYSRQGIYPNGRNVLYADNAVSFMSEQDLHTPGGGRGYSLQQQYDWLMDLHGGDYTDEQKAAFRKFYEVEAPGAPASAAPAAAMTPQTRAAVARAGAEIANLETALDTFEIDTGRYPTTAEGLIVLMRPPGNVQGWRGPYLIRAIQPDPWNNAYIYKCPGTHNKDGYDLSSNGPDGKEGGGDDVDNWSER